MKLLRRISAILIFILFASALQSTEKPKQAEIWPLWENYKHRFIRSDGRVVDWHLNERTTSEGQAYALFFALVANDRETFKKVLQWTQDNLAHGNLREQLPSWLWEENSSAAGSVQDFNSASDADLWIAYSLTFAGHAWDSAEYKSLGLFLAERIAKEEVVEFPNDSRMLMPGRQGFQPDSQSFIVNPSYLPPEVLNGMSAEFPRGPWKQIATNLPFLLAPRVGNGFAMDWVEYQTNIGYKATAGPSATEGGSYDAIRVYLWAGMLDPLSPGFKELMESLSGMDQYMRTHSVPPERVGPTGTVISDHGPVGFSAAMIPFLFANGNVRAGQEQQARLQRERSEVTGLYGKDPRYYDQNLALFSEGWIDGRFHFDACGRLWLRWRK